MKCGISRQRLDSVLAPDQFGVARLLGLEDLNKWVTRHGVYPSFTAPTGVPWSEYIRSQRNRSRSVSSSTEALDSDHARYITNKITQHVGSMAAGTRSLPTDSPVPYFQSLEREHVSEGIPSDIGSPEGAVHGNVQMSPCYANSDVFPYLPSRGIAYNTEIFEQENYLPTLVSMTMTLCVRLDMLGVLWTIYPPRQGREHLLFPPWGCPLQLQARIWQKTLWLEQDLNIPLTVDNHSLIRENMFL